jgi:hypothetical protein
VAAAWQLSFLPAADARSLLLLLLLLAALVTAERLHCLPDRY